MQRSRLTTEIFCKHVLLYIEFLKVAATALSLIVHSKVFRYTLFKTRVYVFLNPAMLCMFVTVLKMECCELASLFL